MKLAAEWGPPLLILREPEPVRIDPSEYEEYTNSRTPDRVALTEGPWRQEGEREVCVPAAAGWGWAHFHHYKEPIMVAPLRLIRRWTLPDGTVLGQAEDWGTLQRPHQWDRLCDLLGETHRNAHRDLDEARREGRLWSR